MDYGYTERDSAITDRLKPQDLGTFPHTYETLFRRLDNELGRKNPVDQASYRAALVAYAAKLAASDETRLIDFENAFIASKTGAA